jgi:uncharacterized protein (TIGR03083 family)
VTLPQADVVNGLVNELESFQTLIAGLSEGDWARPTVCEAWTVGDLAAHVVGVMADITTGRLAGIGTQEWYDRQVADRRGRSPRSLLEELTGVVKATVELMASFDERSWNGPGPPGVADTLGAGVEALWCGFYIHAEDILAALGRPPQKGPGIRAAVSHIGAVLDRRGWGPATLALNGFEEVAIGGGGPRISADPLAFTLVATGRAEPATLGLDACVNIFR